MDDPGEKGAIGFVRTKPVNQAQAKLLADRSYVFVESISAWVRSKDGHQQVTQRELDGLENVKDKEPSSRPAFSAPLWGAIRQGAKELAQILPAFPDSVRPVEEPGTIGNPTSQMVTQEIGTMGGYRAMYDTYAPKESEPKPPEKGKER